MTYLLVWSLNTPLCSLLVLVLVLFCVLPAAGGPVWFQG
jgi:hypothetical protein